MDVRISLRQNEDGTWSGRTLDGPEVEATGPTRDRCLAALRRGLERGPRELDQGDGPAALIVEILPRLAGVAEAAAVMGWDKRRVITYIQRGSFPEPVQSLASGRIWVRSDVERFAREWRSRYERRARRRAARVAEAPAGGNGQGTG
jgi:hypothetical protein